MFTVNGRDAMERGVRLAGALAEAGVSRVVLSRGGRPDEVLTSGNTDLPGRLAALRGESASLRVLGGAAGSIIVAIEPTHWTWAGEGPLADDFGARLGRGPGG